MGIYQYYLAIIPLEGIKRRHNSIPDKIVVCTKTGYFESNSHLYWQAAEKEPDQIVRKIDQMIQRSDWGNTKIAYSWKTKTNDLDNDASMHLNPESLKITHFSFRADLRDKDLKFLMSMITLGKENEWMFIDRNGKLMKPEFEEIKESIMNSNAYRFLKDPLEFLKSLENDQKTDHKSSK